MSRNGDERGDRFLLVVGPHPRYVSTARTFAAAVARHFGCDEDRVQDLKVAISEACSNAVNAHRAAGVNEPIELDVRCGDSRLQYEVRDRGRGFEPVVSVPRPEEVGPSEGGLGVMLIRALFTDAEIARNDTGGMTVRLRVPLVVDEPAP